ncbi:MAG: membrane integrity-associated transporter subunit PqiC [Propionivibrio sp.]|uniref:Membrane integrity-associated transporter subunit PqiC n=1 Tax=Candidatus Propionivibrio dominans TaxID=2954373 RepID=A0A9D7I6Q8_9RHOO|nr:membrane integrity-associated transporter subunit PqiC [Candidatus Propionivibrio dominans]
MISLLKTRPCRLAATGLLLIVASACSALRPPATEQPSFYSLDSVRLEAKAATPASAKRSMAAPTLIVNPTHSASGFNSQRIVYVRAAHQLEYYAHSEWVDTPARMLAPLIVSALENSGAFRAVVSTPSAADGDLRLDSEIIRLQHEVGSTPNRVRFTLRAYMVDNTTRQVLAWQEFDESVAATSEDPYGGVLAANRAVQSVLENLAGFCAEAAGRWQARKAQPHSPE